MLYYVSQHFNPTYTFIPILWLQLSLTFDKMLHLLTETNIRQAHLSTLPFANEKQICSTNVQNLVHHTQIKCYEIYTTNLLPRKKKKHRPRGRTTQASTYNYIYKHVSIIFPKKISYNNLTIIFCKLHNIYILMTQELFNSVSVFC